MKALLAKIRAILKDRKARRFWARVISVMASVVVFISTYALILPAITMETVAACGIEAHQHTDDCYEDILVCGQEESEDHQHTEACYEHVLTCGKEAHIHSTECYKEDSTAVAATGGTSVPVIQEDAQSGSPETSGRDAGSAEAVDEGNEDAAGAGRLSDSDSDSQEPDGSADTSGTWDTSALTVNENAADATTKVLPEDLAEEELAGGYVPALEALNFDALLTKETGFYYFHPEEGQPVPENSSDISDWKELKKDTTLASTDLVKAYLAYSIPAGALNETNQIARYRLPANIHLTDDQILAINSTENGIAASYVIPGTETTDDPDSYRKYLGAEAVEGTRTPDRTLCEGAMEYVSAVVKAENVYENTLDENGSYVDAAGHIAADQGDYIGQDIIFIFTPYTIQKNQNTYDNNGDPIRAGEKVTGWFAVDFNMDQIDWIEQDTDTDLNNSTVEKSAEVVFAQEDAEAGTKERIETLRLEEQRSALTEDEYADEGVEDENTGDSELDEKTEALDESGAADTVEHEEEDENKALEDRAEEETDAEAEIDINSEEEGKDKKDKDDSAEEEEVFKDGTLTADGDGYHITMDYTAEAQIPDKASLSVKEITPDTDPEAYAACLQQAAEKMGAGLDDGGDSIADNADPAIPLGEGSAGKAGTPTLDTAASRFFDIEIVVTDEEGNREKIEPKTPVAVNIQLNSVEKDAAAAEKDKSASGQGSSPNSAQDQKADPTVLHFAEEGVEKIDSTVDAPASGTVSEKNTEDTTAVSFEAESFSIYGVVYTVDFEYEVDGKTYKFSLPGGGFVSFTDLVEVLGIIGDTNAEENGDENGSVVVENTEENSINEGTEENGINSDPNTALTLGDVEVSAAAKAFVADVTSVEFSSPSLVDVSKVENETTVGQIKEDRKLECRYSAELTEEQIAEINAQTVEAGDWALISVQPFTSEESLTVTMKSGEVFSILVTDAQISKDFLSASGETYTITVTYDDLAEIPENSDLNVREIEAESEAYAKYLTDSAQILGVEGGEVSFARFFDIEIVDGKGEKVEPKTPVQVSIQYKDPIEIDENAKLSVVHFAEKGTEVIQDIKIEDENNTFTYVQDSFSITGTIITPDDEHHRPGAGQYMVLVNYPNNSDNYYIVNNDGSLTKVNYNAAAGTVDVENPMLWTLGQKDQNENRNIYFNTEATGFTWQQIASDYYRRYLDASSPTGITEEDADSITLKVWSETYNNTNDIHTVWYNQETQEWVHPVTVQDRSNMESKTSVVAYDDWLFKNPFSGDNHMGVELDANGTPIHLKGQQSAENGVKIVFAKADSVPSSNAANHTVNHIDISISGKSDITVPLAYGTYYYMGQDGQMHEYTVTTDVSLKLEKDNVNITAEDMKHATIKAYDVNGNEVNNAFVIKGYSSNAQNSYSTVQVRIEGDFKVSTTNVQKEWWEDWNSQRIKEERYNNRITYTVSATKELEFPLIEKDNGYGQLYEKLPNGEYIPMSVSLDIDMGASFGFWDEDNACPATKDAVMWPGTHDTWEHGGIPNDLIGMDFELGGDAEKAGSKLVAVEITKLLVDENGHRIHPDSTEHIVNSFNLYQDADGNPNSVVGLNIDNYTTPVDYTGYEYRHSKDLKVGADGMGLVYDYAVTPGMFYLQEDKETIPDTIKDRSGETWHYVGTRIETESPWRDTPDYDGHMHVSDFYTKADGSYNSTPEILGNYNDINGNTRWYNPKTQKEEDIRNGFLEFYVYNVYEPEKTEVTVKKEWENGSAPESASVDVVLKRYKLVKDGSITPPEPTSADLIISDSYSGLSGDRTYSASYHVTGPENFDRTVIWNGEPIVLEDLPFGEYTITKTASGQDGYDADNLREELTVTLGVAGAEAVFAETVYTRQNTTDIYYRVLVYADDTANQGTDHIASNGHYAWVDEEYKAGTVLNFTVGVPAWNNNSTYSYSVNDGSPKTITRGTTATERITVNRDIMIIIYGTTPYYSQWLNPIPSVSIVSVPNQARMMASGMRVLGAAPVTTLTNTGSNPEVPGYTWQEDSTWYDGEGLTVHLPYEGNWEKTVGDLEKEDAFGNLYVYYIASVTENGMPSGMSAQITLNGENKLFVYGDHADENAIHKEDTLKVKNILATGTTITIQKVIKGTLTPLTGAEFTIRKYSDQNHRSEEKTGGFPLVQSVDGNGQIVLDDLQIGYYKLEESNPPAGYVKVSEDPYFEVRQNPSTKEVEVVFQNTSMVTYEDGTFTVQNEPGAALPNTGGSGTTWLYLLGIMLTSFAGTGFVMRKRRKAAA